MNSSLDKDLDKILRVEAATRSFSNDVVSSGLAVLFLGAAGLLAAFFSRGLCFFFNL